MRRAVIEIEYRGFGLAPIHLSLGGRCAVSFHTHLRLQTREDNLKWHPRIDLAIRHLKQWSGNLIEEHVQGLLHSRRRAQIGPPSRRTPLTRRIPAANSGLNRPESAAS